MVGDLTLALVGSSDALSIMQGLKEARRQSSPTSRPKQSQSYYQGSKHADLVHVMRMSERPPPGPKPNTTAQRAREEEQVVRNEGLLRQIQRRWKPGDVYSPRDLSFKEQQKWKTNSKKMPQYDVFELLGLDPVKEYKNFALMSEFMSDTGKILHHKRTGLLPKNQRKIAKAIRRAIGLGLMPSVHKHPEILEREMISKRQYF